MSNVVPNTASATPASAAATSAPQASTLGQVVDADIAAIKSRIAQLESAGKTDWATAVAWAKSNWAHILLTYPAAATILVPVVKGFLKIV